jgi:hypothetical protein
MSENERKKKPGRKGRKIGRNEKSCRKYKETGKKRLNKIRKLKRHMKRFPNDVVSRKALTRTQRTLN